MALGEHNDRTEYLGSHHLSVFKWYSASDIGMSALAANGTHNSSWIPCAGYNQATVMVRFYNPTGDADSGNLTFNIEISHDKSTAYGLQTASTSSGAVTLSDVNYTKDTDNAAVDFAVDFPLNYKYFRIANLTVANGHANEDVDVEVNLGKI